MYESKSFLFGYEADLAVHCSSSLLFQPKDSKKEKESDRGNKVSSYTKVRVACIPALKLYKLMSLSCIRMFARFVPLFDFYNYST